jgi:hypothetical protein
VLLLADLNRGILRSFVGSNWNNGWVAELYALLHFIYLIAIPLPFHNGSAVAAIDPVPAAMTMLTY